MDVLEPPPGCIEIPGFVLTIEPGKTWLTKDGLPTDQWNDRGVWESVEAAQAALYSFVHLG